MTVSSPDSRLALAIKDVVDGFRSTSIWPLLGWQDIKQRYRRSVIGPFWLTLSYGAMIGAMGPLYGLLLKQDISTYFPYLAVSFIVWTLIAGIMVDACGAFTGSEGYIKEVKLPLTIHVLRLLWKNLIIFAHNLIIVAIVAWFYPPHVNWTLILFPASVLLLVVNGVWVGLLLGLLSARFRDIPQVISALVQVLFFMTPVMWRPAMLQERMWFAEFNPLYHFLEVVRAPLLSAEFPLRSWLVVFAITVAGFLFTLWFFSRFRARIAYWL
jgi:ABC-type polysaccharide/polyol phosphate export permease